MIRGFFEGLNERGVSPVIAIVLLLMMTVAAAGAAYFWLTQMQSSVQEQSTESIENIVSQSGRKLMAQAAICEPTVSDGLVGWWEFYEGEGNKTHDSSENENTGTIYNTSSGTRAEWVDGKAGKALDFDGTDDWIDLGDLLSALDGNNFSISLWFTYVTDGNWHAFIIHRPGVSDRWTGFIVSSTVDLLLGVDSGVDGSGDRISASPPSGGVWHHAVGTYDYSSGETKIYLDGSLAKSGNVGSVTIVSGTTAIGRKGSSSTNYHDGKIDEVRIYDRALSAEEINETYKGKMKVKMTVRNIGSVSIPEAKFVANLKKDGTTVDSDTYTTTSSIDTGDLKTLTFYFNEMRPGGEGYMVSIPGIDVSQAVNCQSFE